MSVCMPMAPRWRTSTPSVYLSRSLTVVAGMEAMDMLSRSVTMRALLCSATGTRVAVTVTLSILSVRDWAAIVPADNPASSKAKAIMTSLFIADGKGTELSD